MGQIVMQYDSSTLISMLKEPDPRLRCEAATQLGANRDSSSLPALIEALQDSEASVNECVVVALGNFQRKEAVAALIQEWEDNYYPHTRSAVGEALLAIGRPALETLIAVLQSDSRTIQVRRDIAFILGKIGDPVAVPALVSALHHNDLDLRLNARDSIGEIGDPDSVPALIKAFQVGDWDTKCVVSVALSRMGKETGVKMFIRSLHNTDPVIRRQAAETLGEIRNEKAVPALSKALADDDEQVRQAVADALYSIGSSDAIAAVEAWKR
jgi:HEAT repeat protein